jgi:tagatose 1,6-diphosphate aldolase GatY/KbaY
LNLKDKLKEAQNSGRALLAANFYNLETCKGILRASAAMNMPVILQVTPGSVKYMGLLTAAAIARNAALEEGVECWLHLDHCDDSELIKRCLDQGFDSVMIDASDKEFEENVEVSRKVVEMSAPYNVNVEAELGYVPKPGSELIENKYTNAADAKKFVQSTGVTSLAVAIGTRHGFYKGEPKLDIDRLKKIKETINVILVLHGGSGIPSASLKEVIRNGISKVNIATETKDTFMRTLKDLLKDSDEIDLRNLFPKATAKVQELIEQKIKITAMI